ncbi:hypothetical protein EHG92_25905 [Salmonella enterica]|nr:hypothetical protein [Salmonella enterica]
MSELAGLHQQIDELDEYEQYLLTALLKKASADAGKKLNISERRAVAAEFFASRQDDRKNRASNQRRAHVPQNERNPGPGKERFSLETCAPTTLTPGAGDEGLLASRLTLFYLYKGFDAQRSENSR